jgi:hypothetical protein
MHPADATVGVAAHRRITSKGNGVTAAGRRLEMGRVVAEQQHQPGQAERLGGLVLQLGVGDLRSRTGEP